MLITALALAHAAARAQNAEPPTLLLGPLASYSIGIQDGLFPIYRGSPGCGLFSDGTSTALRFGFTVQWPELFGSDVGLVATAGWDDVRSRYLAYPIAEQRLIDPQTRELIDIGREFHYDAAMRHISLDLLARYSWSERLGVALGPSLGYRYAATFEQSDNVVNPPDRSFADGERVHPMLLGTVFRERKIALGALLSASYRIPLSARLMLAPEISLRGDILSPVLEGSWQGISAGAGVAILYTVPGPAPLPPPPVPPPADTAATDTVAVPPPALAASVAIRGIDEGDRQAPEVAITVRTVIFRQHTPLLPALYFDPNSAAIPERYSRLQQPETESFTLLKIAGLGALELSHNLLDLVGYRMRMQPAARLNIFGATSQEEPPELAQVRGRAVRDYLADVWKISRSRLEIMRSGTGPLSRSEETSEDGRSENRRVTLSSTTPGLLAPLATERIGRDFNPPRIKLFPVIESGAGIRRWSITIRQGEHQLALFEGNGDANFAPLRSDLTWRLNDERIDSTLGRLTAELVVTDSAGQTISATDQLDLVMRRDGRVVETGREVDGDVERLSYSLVAFGYRSSSGDSQHQLRLRELAGRIRDSATVSVTGYTDRIGDDAYNQKLSLGRAEYVAGELRKLAAGRGLRAVDVTASGAGAETDRFPNDLPEGRVLSRGATAVIEQQPEK